MPSARDVLLAVAFRHAVSAANVEEGWERVQALAGGELSHPSFHEALGACLREGLIRDPVRLEAGALQCRWQLELTPAGVAAAHAARQGSSYV